MHVMVFGNGIEVRISMYFLEFYLIVGVVLGVGCCSHPLMLQFKTYNEIAAAALTIVLLWPIMPIIWSIKK